MKEDKYVAWVHYIPGVFAQTCIETCDSDSPGAFRVYKWDSKQFDESLIHQWAEDRGIFEHSDPRNQFKKTLEEVYELSDAIIAGDEPKILDGIGDIVVTLIILAKMKKTTVNECLRLAYNEIKDRKGEMVDGVFVREKGENDGTM